MVDLTLSHYAQPKVVLPWTQLASALSFWCYVFQWETSDDVAMSMVAHGYLDGYCNELFDGVLQEIDKQEYGRIYISRRQCETKVAL